MKKTSILILDDHKLIREMCIELLRHHEKFEVIAQSGEPKEAVGLAKLMVPDIVIIDINLGNTSAFSVIPQLRKASPHSKIIVLTMYAETAYAKKMMQEGAEAYVTKSSESIELIRSIEMVSLGNKYLCSEVKEKLSSEMWEPAGENKKDLSEREKEIVHFIRNGYSSKEIANTLHLSVKTIEVHRYNILKKLRLKNVAGLINYISRQPEFIHSN